MNVMIHPAANTDNLYYLPIVANLAEDGRGP
jgi:hypothetical protein